MSCFQPTLAERCDIYPHCALLIVWAVDDYKVFIDEVFWHTPQSYFKHFLLKSHVFACFLKFCLEVSEVR